MTAPHEASRTLVKSPPELWAELSDPASLGRHLGDFGEIRITRLEPETAVAWEGDRASGTVRLEPSGWGTRVVLTAGPASGEVPSPAFPSPAPPAPAPDPAPPGPAPAPSLPAPAPPERLPDPSPLPPAARKRGLVARILRFLGGQQPSPETAPRAAAPEPAAAPPGPEPAVEAAKPVAALESPKPKAVPGAVDAEDPRAAPGPSEAEDAGAILSAALDSLGQAHHRPFSRS
jgi:hypothetical protein